MATIANNNPNRDPKSKPVHAYDIFHRPGAKRPTSGRSLTVDDLHALRPAICGKP